MHEIEDELHGFHGELKSFPPTAHWFCPKRTDDDDVDYDKPDEAEEDISSETKRELIQDAKRRHDVAYQFTLIFGLDTEGSGAMLRTMLEEYTQRLKELLSCCDRCVRNYHRGRKPFLKALAENFDDQVVQSLADRINTSDFARIQEGLASGESILSKVEPHKRNQSLLINNDRAALLALYESLCCVDFHKEEKNLSGSFNYVFTEIQKKKPLKLGDMLPAMTQFLFDEDLVRVLFATKGWGRETKPITPEEFEWAVHDALSSAIVNVNKGSVSYEEIERFWRGIPSILERLEENLIRHSLRAMEVQPNLYFLALQHLTCNSADILKLVVEALQMLITKSSKDFWAALGTISPATVSEQIFVSPAYEKFLTNSQAPEQPNPRGTALSWIPDFLASLPAVQQHDACRSLLHHLFVRLQDGRFPEQARMACCRSGLMALSSTLDTFVQNSYKINPSTSLVVINDILGLVERNIRTIVSCADLEAADEGHLELKRQGMVVIRDALALDSKALSAQYTALSQNTEIQRGVGAHSQSIWQAVLDVFRPGNLDLAKSILAATAPLTGVDELFPKNKKTPNMPKDHVQYNKDFKQLNENVSRVFERLSDFKPDDLREINRLPQTARPLFAALMSADQSVYEAAVEVIKTMTEQDSRSDAMSKLVEEAFATTLTSLTYAVARITKLRTFTPIVYVIKTSKDVLEALCGSTGVLRTRSALDTHDQNAVLGWWTTQWRVLDMIFSQTENWVARVNKSTKFMEEFCRDDMEYAEKLFDAYSIIATATGESSIPQDPQLSVNPDAAKASRRRVLQVVCQNVNGLSMMLRLRDKYLVSVITSLLSKLLRNLGEYDIEIDEFALNYIKSACLRENERDFKRTNLTSQQKAELQRALSDHQGVEIVEIRSPVVVTAVKKQGTIDAWSKSAEGKVHEPTTSIPLRKDSEKNLAILQQMKARQQAKPTNDFLKNSRQKAAEEKKQRDAAAIARAKALRGPSSLVPGEGSGLSGLGVHGKDHAPIRSEIMVGSSDEDSSEDNEDEDETNALVTKRKETSKMVSEYEESRRRALKAQQQGPVRKTKIQRSAKDLRARVEPNMDKLYLEILNWDIFHEGDIPPSNSEYRKIDNKYLDLDLYKRTFGPLLTSEVWRSLVTAKDENNFKPVEITIMNRLSVDKFMEVSTKMPVAANKDLKLSERDIVLFSKSHDPMHEPQAPHCLARVDRRTMKKDVIEVTYRVSRDCDPRLHQCLVPNGKIHIVKIADMTTTQREFAALSSLEYYDLCNEVLEAKPSPIQKYGDEKIGLMSSKYKLNRGQAQAILSANDNDGFTLIQGPPGSGKTKTIVAMVGALLTQTLQSQGGEQFRAKPQGNAPAAPPNGPKKKLLICAPSNAAVDELVVRLKEGIQPIQGPFQKINVIRIGRSDAINTSVKDVMLDELVQAKLEGDRNDKKGMLTAKEKLHQEAGQIKQKLAGLREQLDQARSQGDKNTESKLQRELDGLYRNRAHINAKIEEDKESGNTVSRDNEINRRRFQQEIIDGAHVLCATLSGSGHDMFRNLNVEFESVIIDEAAQCIELSALIPLKYGCSKCILVGDPEQLPPTVLSKSAKNFGYEQSLFVRMQRNHPKDIHLLDTQYRMHPEISQFPSQQFYNSRLLDGNGMAELRAQPYHASTILGPYRFFDVKGVQSKEARGHSFINVPELNAAMSLYDRLKADYRTYNFKGKIGIIATYKAQLNELRSRFVNRYGEDIFDEIEFNTTDAFQGREREIIIFSCVRATASGGIGFLSDIRRMNVGLTRAKSSLWVLGDSRSLQQGEFWNKLIEDSKARDRYTGGDVLALLSKPTSRDAPFRQRPPPAIIKSESNSPLPQSGSVTNAGQSPVPDGQYLARVKTEVKQEEKDIEMLDAPSVIRSRQSSMGSTSAVSVDSKSGVKRPREPSISDETAKPVKKMPHLVDPSKDKLSKNQMPAVGSSAPSAPKPAPRPHGPPPGAAPRKKKAPPDPFIQRKPPARR